MASSASYQAWVEVVPEFKGFTKSVNSHISKSLSSAADMGSRAIGNSIDKSLAIASANAAQVSKTARAGFAKLTAEVAKAEDGVTNARQRQANASGLLRVAESKLSDVRASGKSSSTQILAAEELVLKRRRESDSASKLLSKSETILTEKQAALSLSAQRVKATSETAAKALTAQEMAVKNVGQASVKLGPQVSAASSQMAKAAESSKSSFVQAGERLGKTLVRGVAVASAAGLAGVGVLGGIALSKGLDRALSIQDATAKLKGLGHSADSVRTILDSALDSVRGTAFGLGDAAGVAAGAVAAGIEPGEKLTKVLKLTADAATIAGTDLNSMGSIFNKVAASGKLQGDVIAQLQDAGVPVLQFVAKQMGVTAEEAANLASEGKVSFETFSAAMEEGLGGAALASGNTARGAFANVEAALGRFGAKFTDPVVAAAPAFFGTLTGAIDKAAERAQPFADKFGKWIGPALENAGKSITAFVNGEPSKIGDFFDGVASAFETISPYFPVLIQGVKDFGTTFGDTLGPAIQDNLPGIKEVADKLFEVATEVLPELLPILGELILAVLPLIPALLPIIQQILPPLIDLLGQLVTPTGDSAGAVNSFAGAVTGVITALGFLIGLLPGPIPLLQELARVFDGSKSSSDLVSDALTGKYGSALQFAVGKTIGFVTGVRDAFSNVRQAVDERLAQVQATGQRVWSSLPAPVQSALSAIGSVVSSGITGAVSTIASLPGRATAALGNLGGALFGAGRSLVDGFVNGITGGIQRAASAAAQLAKRAVDAAKSALDINSPSRVFRDQVGLMVGLGMAEGIDRSASKVAASVDSLATVPDLATTSYSYDASVQGGGRVAATGAGSYKQENNFTMIDEDPQVVARKFGREFGKAIAGMA